MVKLMPKTINCKSYKSSGLCNCSNRPPGLFGLFPRTCIVFTGSNQTCEYQEPIATAYDRAGRFDYNGIEITPELMQSISDEMKRLTQVTDLNPPPEQPKEYLTIEERMTRLEQKVDVLAKSISSANSVIDKMRIIG